MATNLLDRELISLVSEHVENARTAGYQSSRVKPYGIQVSTHMVTIISLGSVFMRSKFVWVFEVADRAPFKVSDSFKNRIP